MKKLNYAFLPAYINLGHKVGECIPPARKGYVTFVCSEFELQSNIPKEVIPLRARGFRLHNTITCVSSNVSMGQYSTNPLTIVLGSASPTSTFSTYRLSASGCLPISSIFPTRISSLISNSQTDQDRI